VGLTARSMKECVVPLGAQLVLAVLFGVAGWHHARHLERKYGSQVWGMPSWAWGLITGFSLLLGIILLAIAERGLKKLPQQAFVAAPAYGTTGYAPMVVPAQAVPAPAAYAPVPVPVTVPAAPSVAAGWQPDPSGKYQHRWWDGERWTSSVSTNGITGVDA
jgi:hypothetical protein